MPVAGSRAGDPHLVGQPALADLMGEHLLRHRRAADVARADERDVQRLRHRSRSGRAQTPSTSRRSSTVATCAAAATGRRFGEVGRAVAPVDHDGGDAVRGGALHVVGAVADHHDAVGQRHELGECVRHHLGLGGSHSVQAGTGDDLEMLVEPEMLEDPPCGRLGLRCGHRQPHSGRPQVGEQLRNAVEQAVHRPAAGRVVGAVGGDRGVGVFESHRRAACGASAARRCGRPGRRRESRHRSRRGRAGSWTRCPAPSRSGCHRGRRSPAAAGSPRRCRPGSSRIHCLRRRISVVMWQAREAVRVRRHRRAGGRLPARAGAGLGLGRSGLRRSRSTTSTR